MNNSKIDITSLEDLNNDSFREEFYFYCQENTALDIKKAFIKQNIRNKITDEVMSFALMAAARSNKIDNAKMLLNLYQKHKISDIKNISFNSALNLAIKKDFLDFAQEFIVLTGCLEVKTYSLVNRESNAQTGVFIDNSGSMKNMSIVESKYNKFSESGFELFSKESEKLDFLLSHKVHLSHIKNMLQNAVEKDNMIPLICVVKSKHLKSLLEDEEFKNFMRNEDFKIIKKEFQNLINNALLEKKLKETLPIKNQKHNSHKI